MLALKLLPSRLPQIRWHGTERYKLSYLMSDADVKKKKKAKFALLPFCAIIFAVIRKVTI